MKNLILLLIIVFECLSIMHPVKSQIIPNCSYIGYEQYPFCYNVDCSTEHHKNERLREKRLYYKVTIEIKDSGITVTKLPILVISKKKYQVDSLIGYYYYHAHIDAIDNKIRLYGNIKACKYCDKLPTAVPKYVYLNYLLRKDGENLILSKEHEQDICFIKQ